MQCFRSNEEFRQEFETEIQEIETEIQYLELQKRRLQSKGGFFTPMKIAMLDKKLNDLRGRRELLKKLKNIWEKEDGDGVLGDWDKYI